MLSRLFGLDELGRILANAKKERIDKQYYVMETQSIQVTKESAEKMISVSENFINSLRIYSDKLNTSSVQVIRKKFHKKMQGNNTKNST